MPLLFVIRHLFVGERSRRHNNSKQQAAAVSTPRICRDRRRRGVWPLAVVSLFPSRLLTRWCSLSFFYRPVTECINCVYVHPPRPRCCEKAASIELYVYISLIFRRSRVSKKGNTPSRAISKEREGPKIHRTANTRLSGVRIQQLVLLLTVVVFISVTRSKINNSTI